MVARDDPYVGRPVQAAATFRVRWTGKLYGGIGGGALLGMALTGIAWWLPRHRSHLPAYSYLAVADGVLYISELAYGSETTVKRQVGNWPIASLAAERLDRPCGVRVRLGEQTIELEATGSESDAAEVVRLLLAH